MDWGCAKKRVQCANMHQYDSCEWVISRMSENRDLHASSSNTGITFKDEMLSSDGGQVRQH